MHQPQIKLLRRNSFNCPYLLLAPMEGVGDRPFRKAMADVGGFDEAVTEFIRVPCNAHVESLAKVYESHELDSIPLTAQIMGSDSELVAKMGLELEKRGAPRIDLNCGCPSNTVTGKGAGSSLLKDPFHLHAIAKALKESVSVPVTVKMRAGFEDTALFVDNLDAAQSAGVSFITLHPRTKIQGYSGFANRDLIKKAKEHLKIPVVGNGDITSVQSALDMLELTSCDALMIGRGAVMDPFIFKRIKAHFAGQAFETTAADYCHFLRAFLSYLNPETPPKTRINKIKQLLSFLVKSNTTLGGLKSQLMQMQSDDPFDFLSRVESILLTVF